MNNEFKTAVYSVICAIPEGHVASYGHIAKLAGAPKHARAVGYLLKHLPSGSEIPWYRVVNSQRKISFPADSVDYQRQLQALHSEGVLLVNGRVKINQFLG
ncbi:MGMT family protein [Pseudoalteromonas fenneropenaei]|uniref:MGMT family protein n=1 Tax=Pseudoalteromonas fenneropenaei TaxID=1737459 RepID=A0ABV7CMA8_9GAMM